MKRFSKSLVLVACLLGGLAVVIGAMGAHGLPDYLAKRGLAEERIAKLLADCETAVRYQMFHALAILAFGLSPVSTQSRGLRTAAWVMLVGVCLFSGGLYSVVFLDLLGHWAIIPSGGTLMILGWIIAGFSILFQRNDFD